MTKIEERVVAVTALDLRAAGWCPVGLRCDDMVTRLLFGAVLLGSARGLGVTEAPRPDTGYPQNALICKSSLKRTPNKWIICPEDACVCLNHMCCGRIEHLVLTLVLSLASRRVTARRSRRLQEFVVHQGGVGDSDGDVRRVAVLGRHVGRIRHGAPTPRACAPPGRGARPTNYSPPAAPGDAAT